MYLLLLLSPFYVFGHFIFHSYVTMMPKLRQALIEFERIEDAIACVTHCQVCVFVCSCIQFLPFIITMYVRNFKTINHDTSTLTACIYALYYN